MEEYDWVDINEYGRIKKLSISTVRRYIKASRVKWKKVEGKYLIRIQKDPEAYMSNEERELLRFKLENEELHQRLRILTEECAELKMLVNLYERDRGVSGTHFDNEQV